MKSILRCMSPWEMNAQSGEALLFENCKGGYFSTLDEYGLRVTGAMSQEGTPTPDNPIPIRCVKAGTKIVCCGKNIFMLPYSSTQSTTKPGVSFYAQPDGSVLITGDNASLERSIFLHQNVKWLIAGQTYTMSFDGPDSNVMFDAWYSNPSYSTIARVRGTSTTTFVMPDLPPDTSINFRIWTPNNGTGIYDNVLLHPQIEIGSIAHSWEPHIGNEITVPCNLYEGDV